MPRTTIPLSMETRDRLKALGRKGETYDDLVNRLIDRHLGVEGTAAGPHARARTRTGSEVDFERIG